MKTCPTCQGNYPNNFAVCPQDGTPLVDAGAWTEGSVVRGKYEILAKIGQGGMGSVYKARHLAFDELRALKVMSPELLSDQLFVKRFKHEAVITRKLQHPHAVRVDDIDESEDGRPFIVMEFIEGRSLKKLIEDEGPLAVPRVCSIIKQVASALDAAHRLGMIHRDIKPDNIVLVETPEGEQAKVLDFGIAKMKEARLSETAGMTLTGTGVVIGTPQYMSPEQAMGKRGDELDGRSDLYSLGIVMYQMLTADLPFKANTTMEMLLAHMQKLPTPIRTLRPDLPIADSMVSLTMRLLEKDRDQRPANARALIQEIERVEKGAAPVGATRALEPTRVVSPREMQSAPAGVAARPAAPAGEPRPPAAPKPARVAAAPVRPAVAPPARESRWGIWVAAVILLVGLGGGGWYISTRRSGPAPEMPKGTTPGTAQGPATQQAAPNPQGTFSPATSSAGSPTAGSPALQQESAGSPGPTTSPEGSAPANRRPPPGPKPVRAATSSGVNIAAPAGPGTPPAVDPKKIKAALSMGDVFYKRGEYDAAISALEEGLRLDPNNPQLRQNLDMVKKAKAAEQRVLQ